MAFVQADLNKEQEELAKLVNESDEARKAYEEFQARINSLIKFLAGIGYSIQFKKI